MNSLVLHVLGSAVAAVGMLSDAAAAAPIFPPPVSSYGDEANTDLWSVLAGRVQTEPFNLVATIIFLLAIIHTFLAPRIIALSHRTQQRQHGSVPALLHFFGEVETVFGLWVVPLAAALILLKGPDVARHYFNSGVSYVGPLFVVVIMVIAASRPIVQLAARSLALIAGRSPARWWLAILTLGPLLGSLITEPAAMTLCAVLLGREFYRLNPSHYFKYATLGLLFVNVSVGGALTSFAAPPILLVAGPWHWGTVFMLQHFGVRSVIGVVVGNAAYFLFFRKEFPRLHAEQLKLPSEDSAFQQPVPPWITAVHLAFLTWTILVAHEPALFIAGFFFFIGFSFATAKHQDQLNIRSPLLVGLFLGGLIIHAGLQAWWIEPLLRHATQYPLLLGATVLTAFNDNAAITYLATLVPTFTDPLRQAIVSGAICGGGLTVIANAPNPAGQSLLQKYFPDGAVSPGALFLAALFPTLVMLIILALPG